MTSSLFPPKATRLLPAMLMLAATSAPRHALAATVDWVDFSTYATGASSQGGFTSSDGLSVSASFSNLTNFSATSPAPLVAIIDDPLWPFENASVSMLTAYGSSADIATQLTLAFDSSGGLPAGGSVAIVDLEFSTSSVALIGLVNGSTVPVTWGFASYQVEGGNVLPPVWNPVTNTLTGPGGTVLPTVNNFVFLTTSVALDEIRFVIQGGAGDGIGFAVAADTVPAPVPVPGTAVLFATAFGTFAARRSRSRRA